MLSSAASASDHYAYGLQSFSGDFTVPAVVRDFRALHPDFDVTGPEGLVVGNVAPMLDQSERLVYTGQGYALSDAFRSKTDGVPISLQVYQYAGGVVRLVESPSIEPGATIDSYESVRGPYGKRNRGPAVEFEVGAAMPSILLPLDLPELTPEVEHATSATITEDVFCDTFTVAQGATLWIDGHLTIVCHDAFTVLGGIELLPESTLTVYVTADTADRIRIGEGARINLASGDHSRVTFFNLDRADVRMDGQASVYATMISPGGTLHLEDAAQFHGVLIGHGLQVQEDAGFHHVSAGICGAPFGDTPGVIGDRSGGAVISHATFAQWFRDVRRVNKPDVREFRFTKVSNDTWTIDESEFYPVDGMLSGNEGEDHNLFFTTELSATFTYFSCTGQYLSLMCSDDGWVTLDDRVVLDLGGLGRKAQVIDMDRLGLNNARDYSLRIFTAHRRRDESIYRITTNIGLFSGDLPVTAVAD
jgi:fibro-slime domain-containing protein